ncbi:dephospho-CoA kinase [Velocimicrobium porci]|nr:dephospho-CoA kinase [Velocimicrobium porci]
MKQNKMKVIGLAGGVGTGKSTVATLLEKEYAAFVIMADKIGHLAMEPGTDTYEKIVVLFGQEVLNEDKTVDRKKVSDLVFSNPVLLQQLNQIIHPFVEQFIKNEIERIRKAGKYSYFFIESAILIETGYQSVCDEIWVVQTEELIRRKRLKQSRGYSDEKIDEIMAKQMGEKELCSYADKILINNGSIEEIKEQLENLLV